MVLTLITDGEVVEVVTKDGRFCDYPLAAFGRYKRPFVLLGEDWFNQLSDIASWVNNELKEECLFETD